VEYIYFDQNVWSNLTDLRKHNIAEYTNCAKRITYLKNLEVVYSQVNVKETLRRNYPADIELELSIISEITSNRLMQENGQIAITTPNFLFSKIALNNYLFSLLSESVEKYVPKNDSTVDPAIKREQNNISVNIAANEVLHKFISRICNKKNDIDFSNFDMICSSLDQKIRELCEERVKTPKDDEMAKKYASLICSILSFSKEIGKIKVKEAMGKDDPNDFISTILSVNPDPAWRTSVIQGMLGAFQYNPDDPKVLRKKGVKVDMDDSDHAEYASHCKYFVSDDKHFRNRTEAAFRYQKSDTIFYDYKQFMDFTEKESSSKTMS